MIPIEDIRNPRVQRLVEYLRGFGVAKVRWSFIWYDDQADPDDIRCYDRDGFQMEPPRYVYGVLEQELWSLSGDYGDYELNVHTAEIETLEADAWRVPMEHGGPGRDEWRVDPIEDEEDEEDDGGDDANIPNDSRREY